jgi:hypothetical protein
MGLDETGPCKARVSLTDFGTEKASTTNDRCDSAGCGTGERVEDNTLLWTHCSYKTLRKSDWELARMAKFFDMLTFHVWYLPDVTGVFSFGVSTELPLVRSLVMFLTRVFLWNAHGIKIKIVV